MKSLLHRFIFLLLLTISLTACERYVAPDTTVRRTLLVYMEARNNLDSASDDDIDEMLRANIPSDCRLIVYQSTFHSAPLLFEIDNGYKIPRKQYPKEASAVDPSQLSRVIADVKTLAPAQEYGLILWSHSSGWQQRPTKSRGFGLENNSAQMPISDLASAINGTEMDFLFFDTCYMGCVEVAYELRHAAHYMVASVCEVPGMGMPYNRTLPELYNQNMIEGLKNAIDITVSSYAAGNGCPSTLSLIDLSKMDNLAQAVKNAPATLPEDFVPQRFSISEPHCWLFYDFGQYFQAIGGDPDALTSAVLHEQHTAMIWGTIPITHCSGLSIFLPNFSQGKFNYDSYGYSSLQWYKFLNQN